MISRKPASRFGAITPWLVLAASLLFTAAATTFVGWSARAADEARFQNAVQDAHDRIATRLEVYLATLRGGAALFAASDSVSAEEFRHYAERLELQRRYPGIQGIGWTERIATGLPGEVDERHAIRYLVPMDARNEAAIGFDMYSEPVRRAAMRAARDRGGPALSGKVTLVQEIAARKQAGFLLYLPVYRSGDLPRSLEERRELFTGFVYSPFRADDLFAGLFGSEQTPRVSFRVYDGDTTDSLALLHASPREGTGEPERTARRVLEAGGHPWTVVYASEPAFEEVSVRFFLPAILLTGLLVSALLSGLAWREARARLDAEGANRAKSEFLSAMSHELRTPLNAIAGYVDLLDLGLRGPMSDGQRAYLRRIQKAQEHLLSLINDVLHFAKLEAGRLELSHEVVRMDWMIAELDEMVAPQVQARELTFEHSEIDRTLRVLGDPDRIRQILLNLITNAVKFTPRGGRISLSARRSGEMVEILVADSGRGIPQDKLEAVFDPFVQLDRRSFEDSQQGVGLGLAISRDLARTMEGDLVASSDGDRGSCFHLRLPAARE